MMRMMWVPGCFAAAVLGAQPGDKALLWTISRPGVENVSYVYGTVHSKDDRAFVFVDGVERAMRSVNTVAGELDLNQAGQQATALMGRMMMPDGGRLQDLYSKKEWSLVDAYLKAELGFMAPLVQRMKPFFVMSTLTEQAMGGTRPQVLDDHLMKHARAQGHRTIGLESIDEQLRAMDVLSLNEQAQLLLQHVKENGQRKLLEEMMDAYVQQDLATLMRVSAESGSMPPKLEKALLTDRNQTMAHRMDSVVRADGSAMFLVGAAHLPGLDGVLQLLAAKGYAVSPASIAAASTPPELPAARVLAKGVHYVNDTLGFRMDMPVAPRMVAPLDAPSAGWVLRAEGPVGGLQVAVSAAPQEGATLEEAISVVYIADSAQALEPMAVQGVPARRFSAREQGSIMRTVFVLHKGALFMVMATSAQEEEVDQALSTFRFLDLPE